MAETAAVGWVVSPIIKILVDKVRSYIENQYNWHKDIQRSLEKLEIALAGIQTVAAAAERQQSLDASQARVLRLLKDAVYEADDLLDEYEYRRLEAQTLEASGMHIPQTFTIFVRKVGSLMDCPRLCASPRRRHGRSMMDIGMDYFNQLLSRSFLQKSEETFSINQLLSRSFLQKSEETFSTCYIMHDIIHDLAQTVSSDECLRIDGGTQWEIPQTIRHLGVRIRGEEEFKDVVVGLKKMNNVKYLRSLIFFGWSYFSNLEKSFTCWKRHSLKNSTSHFPLLDVLEKSRSLRVLDLDGVHLENFQEDLSHLRHLRYLNLGDNSSIVLPGSVCRLYHLTGLDVKSLQVNVEKKKKNRGVGALQVVKVAFPKQLRINNLQYCRGREEALQADLEWKHSLNSLVLEWGSSGRIVGHDVDAEVAEALKPHPNLKHLIIKGFRGSRLPSWLDREWLLNLQSLRPTDCWVPESLPLTILSRLVVSKCPNLTSFPPFLRTTRDIFVPVAGSVSLLKLESPWPESFVLTICGIRQADGAFLHDHQLRAIHELWIDDGKEAATAAGIAKVTTLKKLSIEWCPELFMSNQGMFESLMIDDFPDTDSWLSRCLQGGLTSLSKLKIINCTELTSLPSAEVLQSLTALQVLEIWRCQDLTSLGGLHALAALKKLEIRECRVLLTSEKDGRGVLPSSLDTLLIYGCHLTNRWLSRCLQGAFTALSVRIDCCSFTLVTLEEEDGHDVLPLSLESLEIERCPVTDRWLSRCLQGGLTSVSKLKIINCTGLTSLPSAEVLHHLTALKDLQISGCEDLTSCRGLQALATLKKLDVSGCPWLLTSEKDGCYILPSSLESLEIHDCPVTDTWLSRCLQGDLTSLSKLKIINCTGLTSFPSAEVLHHLTALEDLHIISCEDLTSFGGLQALATLKKLEITDCPGLLMSEEEGCCVLPSSLESLEIKHCPVTDMGLSRCLQGSLTALYGLGIWWCTGFKSLPSVEVLQSLTALQMLSIWKSTELMSLGGLHSLAALKHLQVEDCPNMKSLPEDAMPASIEHLILRGCDPALQQQIHDKKGPDWEKVAHIPHVWI